MQNVIGFEPVIGLEVHAELKTQSKMFCACPVVDGAAARPNSAVCPICSGMPGTLPVINRYAVELGIRVALALQCEISEQSIFARKNYFYPDLPKGYQISQYEQPLARNGRLTIQTSQGERVVRIRRVHLEEDTGKLTHVLSDDASYSLIDLNRAGVPLLEIVSEPDLHSAEEVRSYAMALRSILCYLDVNSGDMEKGVLRIEPNISVRPMGSEGFGTRTEIKNLNSFRVLERSVSFEIQRQSEQIRAGYRVVQETRGWDESNQATVTQRIKEEANDYRYFPEPDLPPLVIDSGWLEAIRAGMPELPREKIRRFQDQYHLSEYDAGVLTEELEVANFFEEAVLAAPAAPPKTIANWISGDLFGILHQAGVDITDIKISPDGLAELARMVYQNQINQTTAKAVLVEMSQTGRLASEIVAERNLAQISDEQIIGDIVERALRDNPAQVSAYQHGKITLKRWFLGQVMRLAGGRADPQIVEQILSEKLDQR